MAKSFNNKLAKKSAKNPANEICRRVVELRLKAAGLRGKSKFAKQLGISPSTYDYYEGSRTPPAEMLVRIAEVAGADLHWLLTGQLGAAALGAEDHPVLRRAAKLLADCPDAAGALGALVDLLIEARKFPAKAQEHSMGVSRMSPTGVSPMSLPAGQADPTGVSPVESVGTRDQHGRDGRATHRRAAGGQVLGTPNGDARATGREAWIPILGRTAAGVARFWGKGEDVSGLTTLADLVARHAGQTPQAVRPAVATEAGTEADAHPPAGVQLVTLSAPDQRDAIEFVAAEAIKRRYPDAFALRVDGDSMAPQILQGDVVVLSPSVPADDGRAAVVQAAGQIGVTCKLYRKAGGHVHLVPVNSRYEIADVEAGQVEWALRVLARVRPGGAGKKVVGSRE
jgi:transcriptional regulator with XRE-family HTH domain